MSALRGWPSFPADLPEFDPGTAPERPHEIFLAWLEDAGEHVLAPHAVTLSTVDADDVPDARVVILKDVDAAGWYVATSSESPKGVQLGKHPMAALTFFWAARGRQVRIRGTVTPSPSEVSRNDFLARSPESRVEAFIGNQSAVLRDPAELEAAAAEAREWVAENPYRAPETWVRYLVAPVSVEFWQARHDRRHVRLRYRLDGGRWVRELLWP
ncbi:pyridoxine/pyridoxamine 5'-phosphate oxidase [Amycolatopsis sp. CA-230715]|uniref:pyridoxine/pyridoxamine 5'-phosphate oxidase n=1 Tax=Amycolatopsis sp. CA-230715 TaxID=2745196 RepID=UPI001C015D72|nr:pyridoxal 5'-phosphate synthase [Amycolatopsis sp. CA-230715]QWF80416.1 Pyridoxine/pyridoxamine 5'-phosphate oxidase [Amycolatopsis sp. CA-230715]